MNENQKRIYTARIVFSEAHQADSSYQEIPEGYLVYLKGPSGDENYLGKDGAFSGNVNSDQYAHLFDSREEARDVAESRFYSIYSPAYNVLKWASLWDTHTRSRDDDELAMERANNDFEKAEEPVIDDAVRCCPECERPNQFGELCFSCIAERAAEDAEV